MCVRVRPCASVCVWFVECQRKHVDRDGEWKGKSIKEPGKRRGNVVQELCESRGGRPGLSVLTSLLASVDLKLY